MVKFFVLCLLVAFSASRAFKIFPLPAISRNQHQLWKPIPRRNPSRTLRVQCESPNNRHDESCKPIESELKSQVASTNNETVNGNATTEVQALDPTQVALKEKEDRLTKELQAWQDTLVSERIHLLEVRDKLFGSGKDAYYAVQAEVNDFVRNRDAAQKADVSRNKRLFVEKMLPIVDAFRHASAITPTSTPKIESMHTNYGSLLNYILMVFAKYGYQEFAPAVGDALDATQHEVLEVREPSTALEVPSNSTHAPPVPVVVEVLRTGWRDAAQTVLRKSTVVASGALNATSTDGNAALEDVNGAQPIDNANNDNEGPTTGEGGE